MPQQTPAQARVIDPILTSVARGYRSNKSPIANLLFPLVGVTSRGGTIISFGKEDFKLISSARAPGSATKRIQFGYDSGKYSLTDYRLEGSVPLQILEEGQAVPGINHANMAIGKVRNMQALEREKQAADMALNAASYAASNKVTLSGTDRWDDYVNSDPVADVNDAKEAVRAQIGIRPNVLVLGPKVLTAVRSHTKILARLSTAQDRPPATLAQLALIFEVAQVVEGEAIYHDGTSFQDVWGKYALLAYTEPASLVEMGSPNFGYTYQLENYPVAEEAYFDRNTQSWYYPVADARQPQLVGASAGFLFSTVVN